MKKRFLSIVLAALSCVLLIAPAAADYRSTMAFFDMEYYDGRRTDSVRLVESASNEGWSYDADTATLTLDGLEAQNLSFYDIDRVVTIVLADGSENSLCQFQLTGGTKNVIITGSGTLNLIPSPLSYSSAKGDFNNSLGFADPDPKLIIESGTININGMFFLQSDLEIAGGTVTGNTGMSIGNNSLCTVTGGTLILNAEASAFSKNDYMGGDPTGLEDAVITGADGAPLSIQWADRKTQLYDAAGNIAAYAKITAGGTPAEAPSAGIFADVPGDAYYADAVSWAYNHEPQITTGTSETEFSPAGHVTRAQAVTFLWRVMGCPEPASPASDFSDVQNPDSWFYKAVLWAVEQGITNGTGNGQFSPDQGVTRGQMITFLYRAMGEPGKTGTGEWYTDAENWARQNGLLDGTAAAYETNGDCPRSDVVYYLWKQLAG